MEATLVHVQVQQGTYQIGDKKRTLPPQYLRGALFIEEGKENPRLGKEGLVIARGRNSVFIINPEQLQKTGEVYLLSPETKIERRMREDYEPTYEAPSEALEHLLGMEAAQF